jgi:hypothetical protein
MNGLSRCDVRRADKCGFCGAALMTRARTIGSSVSNIAATAAPATRPVG